MSRRFVRAGANWEGRTWVLNPAVASLCDQVEAEWPERHAADGTVASKGHDKASPTSDHRPYPYTGLGVVCAVDVGEVTENDGELLAEGLRQSRDPRIKYVIHEGRLFSSYAIASRDPWEWGAYTGVNAHLSHVHVSTYRTAGAGPWNLNLEGDDVAEFTQEDRELLDWIRQQVSIGALPSLQPYVEKAKAAKVYSSETDDTDIVTGGTLAAILDRAGVLDPSSPVGSHTHPFSGRTGK